MTDHAVSELVDQTASPDTRRATARVVLGPKTRLGQALIARAAAEGHDVIAIARDDRDLAALSGSAATVVTAADAAALLGGVDTLHLHVCALGPVHPTAPEAADSANAARDLDLVRQLLDAAPTAAVHAVLVSTVIALAPGDDRRYYGGWKCLVEQQLRELLADRPAAAELSVAYPGRLMAHSERRRPWHRAHTTYPRLAELVEELGRRPGVSRVVGLDARAWLVARGASLVIRSLSGSRGVLRRREAGPPHAGREAGHP